MEMARIQPAEAQALLAQLSATVNAEIAAHQQLVPNLQGSELGQGFIDTAHMIQEKVMRLHQINLEHMTQLLHAIETATMDVATIVDTDDINAQPLGEAQWS